MNISPAAASLVAAMLLLAACKPSGGETTTGNAVQASVTGATAHPCAATGTQLTGEDCAAAAGWIAQARQGSASFNAPKSMIQGQTKTVILAIGATPPPDESNAVGSVNAAGETNAAATNALPASNDVATNAAAADANAVAPAANTAAPTNAMAPRAHIMRRGPSAADIHGTVAPMGGQIVDYHPLVGRQMVADLEGDGFDIKPLSPRAQMVTDVGITTWEWQITANDYGDKTLVMKTAVAMIDSQGKADALVPTGATRRVRVWIGPTGVLGWLNAVPTWLKAITAVLVALAALLAAWRGLRGSRKP